MRILLHVQPTHGAFNEKRPMSPSRKAIVQTQSMKRQIANLKAMADVPQVAAGRIRATEYC